MDDTLWLYTITRLDDLRSSAQLLAFISALCGGLSGVAWGLMRSAPEEEDFTYARPISGRVFKSAMGIFIVAGLVNIVTPSQRDALFIIGGSTLLEIAKTDDAKRIASKSVQAVEQWIDQHIDKPSVKDAK
jgi:hypothetical protein